MPSVAKGEAPIAGSTRRGWLLLLVPLALSAWVYHPITRIQFFSDDFVHLIHLESQGVLDFLFAPFGGHNYFVRNVVWLATWEMFGLHSFPFYATALLTHLLNVALLFGTVRRLSGSSTLACFGAALWGTSPLCLGVLGWYSVFGQALATTVLLIVLYRLAYVADRTAPPTTAELCIWYGLLLAGTTCFGVGIGVAVTAPLAVFLFLPGVWSQPRARLAWLLLPLVTLDLYFGLRRLYMFIGQLPLDEVVQEAAALQGVAAVPVTFAYLFSYSIAGSILGFLLPKGYPTTASILALAAFLAGFGVLMVRADPRTRRAAAALAVLAAGIYLVIAAGRGHMFALFNVGPAAVAQVVRFHYAGSAPVVILICLIVQLVGRLPVLRRVPGTLALACGLGVIAYGAARVGLSVNEFRASRAYIEQTREAIATSVRASPPDSTVYIENDKPPPAVIGPAIPLEKFPGRAAIFLLLQRSDKFEGRTVRFIERDVYVLAEYAARPDSRLARLLTPPYEVPPDLRSRHQGPHALASGEED